MYNKSTTNLPNNKLTKNLQQRSNKCTTNESKINNKFATRHIENKSTTNQKQIDDKYTTNGQQIYNKLATQQIYNKSATNIQQARNKSTTTYKSTTNLPHDKSTTTRPPHSMYFTKPKPVSVSFTYAAEEAVRSANRDWRSAPGKAGSFSGALLSDTVAASAETVSSVENHTKRR
jgi:hypothetical protein